MTAKDESRGVLGFRASDAGRAAAGLDEIDVSACRRRSYSSQRLYEYRDPQLINCIRSRESSKFGTVVSGVLRVAISSFLPLGNEAGGHVDRNCCVQMGAIRLVR